jgi:hypothetical protein
MCVCVCVKHSCSAGLVNTGLGNAGSSDPNWKVTSVPSGLNGFAAGSNAVIMTPNDGWASSASWPSKWIGVTTNGNTAVKAGDYVYQLTFSSASYYSTSVVVYFLVDNAVTSVKVTDGSTTIQITTTFSGGGKSFNCFSSFVLSAFGPSVTTLSFTVKNDGTGDNPSGLLVQFGVFNYIAACPTPVPCKLQPVVIVYGCNIVSYK